MTISYDKELQEIWEKKEKALKHLAELSKKSLGQIPQLDEPNDDQKQWLKEKMKGRIGQ